MKDINSLKELLNIQKNNATIKEEIIQKREQELKESRDKTLDTTKELSTQINDLTIKQIESDKKIENLLQEVKKLKVHKKVLKEEVVSLRQKLNEQDIRCHNKTVAL